MMTWPPSSVGKRTFSGYCRTDLGGTRIGVPAVSNSRRTAVFEAREEKEPQQSADAAQGDTRPKTARAARARRATRPIARRHGPLDRRTGVSATAARAPGAARE